jgi:hypothetical protein
MLVRDIPIDERRSIIAAIPRIQFAVRLALRRSAKAIQASCEASTDKFVRERARSAIISDVSRDLAECSMHATGHHVDCRRAVCPLPEDTPVEILTAFEQVRGDITRENVTQVVTELCVNFPALAPKKIKIIHRVRLVLECEPSVEVDVLRHAYDDHAGCSDTCRDRPLILCDLAKVNMRKETSFLVAKAGRLVENHTSNAAESMGAMVNQFYYGRRTNITGRGVQVRQATLAGLTMARGYKVHRGLQQKMNFKPSNVLDTYANHVAKRRQRARDNRDKRRRLRKQWASAGSSTYKKEQASDAFANISAEAMEVLKVQRLSKINAIDTEMAKMLENVDSASFKEALGDRMLSETAATLLCKRKLEATKPVLNSLLAPVPLVPWHLTNVAKEKAVIQSIKGKITPCGLYVCPFDKCFAAKPDGIIDSIKATFRILKGRHSDPWVKALAQMDMVCSGMERVVFVVGTNLVEEVRDPAFKKQLVGARDFFESHMLPALITRC